jgi:transposase
MLPQSDPAPQAPATTMPTVGVGIDTARYGHYAAFTRHDLQPAAAELAFAESADGYGALRQRLERLAEQRGPVRFVIRLDAAGQYADNLLHFLHRLAESPTSTLRNCSFAISCGDPQRNKNYRAAIFGPHKSDPIEARAAARFAVTERPPHTPPLAHELRLLRQVAGRLQAAVRQRTRLINQFHHLLTLTFPELAVLVKNISIGWVLELVHRYPSAAALAQASNADLAAIPYLPDAQVEPLLNAARASVASLDGPTAVELVRDQVRQLRDVKARQKRLETLLVGAYQALPEDNQLASIPGIGAVTAAVLTAFTLDIKRFATPNKLVAYFGAMPVEASSGVDRAGQPRGPRRYVMSKRGNDLVRRYLWMAALSAIRYNPAVRALYLRVVARNPNRKAVVVGHAMRKLLHLVFAVWQTGKPFDPTRYPPLVAEVSSDNALSLEPDGEKEDQAAGLTRTAEPAPAEVTAACADSVADTTGGGTAVDFGHVKRQLPLARVLEQLGLSGRLQGKGPQRRCACPIHRGDGRGRTFSVNLDAGVFHCFDKTCAAKGDVIDLWAALHHLDLRAAALDLVRTFDIEPTPRRGTGKRNG